MPQTYNVTEDMHLDIRGCRDRVTVMGWDQARSMVADAAARQEGNTFIIENARRLTVRLPRTASVTIADCEADVRVEDLAGRVQLANVRGDVILRGLAQALVRDLDGDLVAKGIAVLTGEGTWDGDAALRGITERLEVNEIDGDASLGDMGAVILHDLDGDLSIRGVRSSLQIGDVQGDVDIRGVDGDLNIARIEGDFALAGVRGVLDAPEIKGDAMVTIDAITSVVLTAGGDVVVNLPSDANADIELDAPHGDLVARGNIQVLESDEHHLRGKLGTGGAPVRIESLHDDLIVRTGAAAPRTEYGPRPFAEFGAPFVELGQDFAQMGREMGRRIAEETRESVEKSLTESGLRRRARRSDERSEASETPTEDAPKGPVPGSPERKAILDAVARGELSVDEAIRKIKGEE